MTWARFGKLVRLAYLLRVPLITQVILAGLGPLADSSPAARKLLGGLLDVGDTFWRVVWVSAMAFLVSASATVAINIVLVEGGARFESPFVNLPEWRARLRWWILAATAGAPLVLLGWVVKYTQQPLWTELGGVALGLVFALGVMALALLLQALVTDPGAGFEPVDLVFSSDLADGRWARWVERVDKSTAGVMASQASARAAGFLQGLYRAFEPAAQGYLRATEDGRLRLNATHTFALFVLVAVILFYILTGLAGYEATAGVSGFAASMFEGIAPLAYLLLALQLACKGFAAAAFFLDRYRMPLLLTALVVFMLTTGGAPESDHFYRAEKHAVNLPSPADVIAGRERIVVVAAAGGGIQAAAWTTQVLAGLQTACPAPCNFSRSVAAVSGISGGSVGLVQWGASFDDPGKAVERSQQSSMENVTWGFVYPDLMRAVFPWLNLLSDQLTILDRGWALERSIERISPGASVPMRTWGEMARKGDLPAFLFSTTMVEVGAPMVFSTTTFPQKHAPGGGDRIYSFHREYPGFDVNVMTAARLSAAFPYVSPVSRSLARCYNCTDYHLADGGYYDNYGVDSLLAWLEEALEGSAVREVLVVLIRPFPSPGKRAGERHGWFYQGLAPPIGYLNVRETAQLARSAQELDRFARAQQNRTVRRADFELPVVEGCEPPLNWRLREAEKTCLDMAWKALKGGADVGRVVDFLSGK